MKKVALITGASSGFGLEFAGLFAKAGYDLVITAKPPCDLLTIKKNIESQYGVRVCQKAFDLSVPGNPERLYKWTSSEKINVSVLVNNAGLGLYGKFTDHKLDEEKELVMVNTLALTELCHLYLPYMVKQKSGKILNISSIAGLQAGPYYATYFASKAYVLLFTEALQIEYASDNINITALCPGVSKTSFFENANMRQDSKMFKFYLMNPNKVALAGYKGLNNNKKVVIPGFRNKIVSIGYRIMPRSIINRITKNLILKAAK